MRIEILSTLLPLRRYERVAKQADVALRNGLSAPEDVISYLPRSQKSIKERRGLFLLLSLLIAAALNGLMLVSRVFDHDASHLFSGFLAKRTLRQLLDDLYEAGLGGSFARSG